MIPGTIEEWKKAMKDSKPGIERAACVYALSAMGAQIERRAYYQCEWMPHNSGVCMEHEYRVKPTARPWNAEDAGKHIGYAYRLRGSVNAIHIVSAVHAGMNCDWTACEYARPIPGTDPETWDWKKCEVVE